MSNLWAKLKPLSNRAFNRSILNYNIFPSCFIFCQCLSEVSLLRAFILTTDFNMFGGFTEFGKISYSCLQMIFKLFDVEKNKKYFDQFLHILVIEGTKS